MVIYSKALKLVLTGINSVLKFFDIVIPVQTLVLADQSIEIFLEAHTVKPKK